MIGLGADATGAVWMAATKMTANHDRRQGDQVGLFFDPRGQPVGDREQEVGYALHESWEGARSGHLVDRRVAHGLARACSMRS